MILNCAKCSVRYLVADAAIGEGRSVRCANCGHVWHQLPLAAAMTAFEEEETPPPYVPHSDEPATRRRPMPRGSNLPVVVVTYQTPRWLKRLCVGLITLIIVFTPFAYRKSILEQHPEISFLFEPFGIYATDGLVLADVSLTKAPTRDGNPVSVTLNCAVLNEALGNRPAPAIAATLLDANGRQLGVSPDLVETGQNMISGDLRRCTPFTFVNRNNEIARVRLDLADLFDFSLRHK